MLSREEKTKMSRIMINLVEAKISPLPFTVFWCNSSLFMRKVLSGTAAARVVGVVRMIHFSLGCPNKNEVTILKCGKKMISSCKYKLALKII